MHVQTNPPVLTMAMDRSCRSYDVDGRLHVAVANISKACVNPYYGREIPDYENLGLDPDKVYQLFRDPEELRKAAATANNIPLLSKHVPVTAEKPEKELVVGSLGTDAAFNEPYLTNSLVVWDADAIALIESDEQRELSCAYRYVAVMTPGKHKGLSFDGVMTNLTFNHTALVRQGRAGPDVVIGDAAFSNLGALLDMKLNSRTALVAQGAISAYLAPKLAQDAKIDISPILKGVTGRNFKSKRDAVYGGLVRLTKGKLAADADIGGVVELLDALAGEAAPEDDVIIDTDNIDEPPPAADPTEAGAPDNDEPEVVAKIMDFLKDKLQPEDLAALAALVKPGGAMDEPPPVAGTPETGAEAIVDKPAMDAAIKIAVKQAQKNAAAVRQAERDVRPYIGELAVAMDSASDIYRMALEKHDVDLDGVHPSAFPALLKMVPVPGARTPRLAQDSAANTDFDKRFPGASRIRRL